jgi:dTDP-4-dehydrorhamnose reductase
MKLFVTGAGGQLGHELIEAIRIAGHEPIAATHAQLDITDEEAVRIAIGSAKPDVVIHAAAWTAVDACEGDIEKAMLVNGTASKYVADAAHAVGARVVYISTDYVFDGSKPTPYNEDDVPNPQSAYGASKLAGEQAMSEQDAIVRISWVCGFHGANMVKTILKLGATMSELKFVDDQIGNPTFADDAAKAIVNIATSGLGGVWHVTNQGVVSWYEFAREVLLTAGMDAAKVKPISTSDLQPPRPAKRPANSVLHNGRMIAEGMALLPDFREPLARLVRRLQAETGE